MLANAFKTAVELGISDEEFEALFHVLGMLERGELEHVQPGFADIMFNRTKYENGFSGHFNMLRVAVPYKCGTVACIMGTAHLLFGKNLFPGWNIKDGMSGPLYELFFPINYWRSFLDITPAQAAIALRNYLTTGEPRWSEALAA